MIRSKSSKSAALVAVTAAATTLVIQASGGGAVAQSANDADQIEGVWDFTVARKDCASDAVLGTRLAPCELREGHHTKQIGTAQRAYARVPLCRSTIPPKVFHGTNSITSAKSVLPTFMRHPGSFKPGSIASQQVAIQIVDTHESLETRVSLGFAAG